MFNRPILHTFQNDIAPWTIRITRIELVNRYRNWKQNDKYSVKNKKFDSTTYKIKQTL